MKARQDKQVNINIQSRARSRREMRVQEGVPTLFLGDLHYGAVIHPEQVEQANMYSREIAEARLEATFESFLAFVAKEDGHEQFHSCVVVIPGDAVEGEVIVDKLDGHPADNARRLAEVLFRLLTQLGEVFSDVYVVCVAGNHGRTERRQASDSAVERNYDTVCYAMLNSLCVAAGSSITVQYSDKTNMQWYEVYDTPYVVIHGEEMPVGSKKDLRRGPEEVRAAGIAYRKLLLEQANDNHPRELKNQDGLVLLAAHNHCAVDAHKAGFIATGSLRGIDRYVYGNPGWSQERPAVMAWITRPNRGITSIREILVDEHELLDEFVPDDYATPVRPIQWKPSAVVQRYYSARAA